MVKNYLLVALRSIRKHFAYSVINIAGLGLGLTICLLIVVWIQHELSYDRFHAQSATLYRASLEYSFGGQTSKTPVSPTALLPEVQRNFPEVLAGVRFYNTAAFSPVVVSTGDVKFQETSFFFADSTFFTLFSFPLLEGTPVDALAKPNSVVISQAMAEKYFGNDDAIGRTLKVNNGREYAITGVMANTPDNSTIQADFIASFSTLPQSKEEQWWSANYQTFFLLSPDADLAQLTAKTNELVAKALASELTNENDYIRYNWISLPDIHLYSDMNEQVPVGDIQYVYIFSAVAIIILLLAAINYINLTTARALDRAKEVGVRKAVGAVRRQLVYQHLTESLVITAAAFASALVMAQGLLPFFNAITGKILSRSFFLSPEFIGASSLTIVAIALLAGAYPAMAITSFRPSSILRGSFKTSAKGIWLRQGLVVAQFCISLVLMVGTITISRQLGFMQTKKLGYQKDNVIVLPLDQKVQELYPTLKTEFLRTGGAVSVSRSTESPVHVQAGYSLNLEGSTNDRGIIIRAASIDQNFLATTNMTLIAGRDYTEADMEAVRRDTAYSFIVNESALKAVDLMPEDAIGKRATVNGRRGEIIGVVEDFHFSSLHEPIAPFLFFNEEQQYNYLIVKIAGNVEESLRSLKAVYANVVPHRPFEYEFLDQQYASLYTAEQRLSSLFTIFAALAIVIACLGLFGLVSFSAAQKTKEIGIRKVLGATATSIVMLITRDYVKLVVIAIAVALPVSLWVNTLLLQGFAYKVTVGPVYLMAMALAALVLALGTASFQAVKASLANPSDSLRSE